MCKQTGRNVAEPLRIFYFNRLAARVFTLDPEDWSGRRMIEVHS